MERTLLNISMNWEELFVATNNNGSPKRRRHMIGVVEDGPMPSPVEDDSDGSISSSSSSSSSNES